MDVAIQGSGMDAEIVGRVTYPIQFEGPPGCVHGGFLAMAFDELLGYAQAESGNPGMTAHIEVDFRAPSPLGTELVFRARCDRVEGRKIHVSADLHHGDQLCAQARAIFISMRPEVFEQLMALREARRSGAAD
jgi:acyl-coenzyme A thioesterase PaaI-like protein